MNAIALLERQHRETNALFATFEKLEVGAPEMQALFEEIADQLAAHARIEELHFYPALKLKQTEGRLDEALEDHLEVKRMIAELMEMEVSEPEFRQLVLELKEAVMDHVGEEESDMFPKVRGLFTVVELEAMGEEMENTMAELLAEGQPSANVPAETDAPAPI